MGVISKALRTIIGPTAKSQLVPARYILCPVTSVSVSRQESVALLPLSCYQNPRSFAVENLVGYRLSQPDNFQTKRKCKLKTEMPQILERQALWAPAFSRLACRWLWASMWCRKEVDRDPLHLQKNHSWGDFLPNILLWKVSNQSKSWKNVIHCKDATCNILLLFWLYHWSIFPPFLFFRYVSK